MTTKAPHKITLGREPLVRNLVGHLTKGTWAVVAGGPKIGKTTLLQQAAGNLLDGFRPVLINPVKIAAQENPTPPTRSTRPAVLLMDGCDALLPDPGEAVRWAGRQIRSLGGAVRAVVWAGGVAWGGWAMAHPKEFGHPIRYYPLTALPPKEARPILLEGLPDGISHSEVERLLALSGGHPYLLKRLLDGPEPDVDRFFAGLWKAADAVHERAVLGRLISAGRWVSLEELRDLPGGRPTKSTLDRLAMMGLIQRTLVDGAAAVRIISPWLAEWVRRSKEY